MGRPVSGLANADVEATGHTTPRGLMRHSVRVDVDELQVLLRAGRGTVPQRGFIITFERRIASTAVFLHDERTHDEVFLLFLCRRHRLTRQDIRCACTYLSALTTILPVLNYRPHARSRLFGGDRTSARSQILADRRGALPPLVELIVVRLAAHAGGPCARCSPWPTADEDS